ncbi:hypothetical protein CEE44_00730 [Candidatus Woesearchaeota archaeon B3_Woes]|nr:MAG: hypothetical protein CEE44_00730 [Candidatus Woesearchaeota archaeon B3_Woes]
MLMFGELLISKLLLLFAIFSIAGWVGELFYRNFISKNKNLNPGFLKGPYLPIFGFGAVLVYLIFLININLILMILISTLILTLLEFTTGLILLKFNIELWNYSTKKFNYKGLISLGVVVIWIILCIVSIIWLFPLFKKINVVPNGLMLGLGFFYIIVISDAIIRFYFLKKKK